jgi:hypothetical protein
VDHRTEHDHVVHCRADQQQRRQQAGPREHGKDWQPLAELTHTRDLGTVGGQS